MPQYPVGHPVRIAGFRNELGQKLPGVYAFGAGYDAIGMPDCIKQAKETAESAAAGLKKQPEPEAAFI
ncbi:Protoporphyrinogen oxidase [compost metagenome]